MKAGSTFAASITRDVSFHIRAFRTFDSVLWMLCDAPCFSVSKAERASIAAVISAVIPWTASSS